MSITVPEMILGAVLVLGITAIAGYWMNRSGLLSAIGRALEQWVSSHGLEHRRGEIWEEGYTEGYIEGKEAERIKAYLSKKNGDEA